MSSKVRTPAPASPAPLPASLSLPFGPGFFLTQLAAFVRDSCPASEERLPCVQLHLATGEVLELCHVVALAPRWVAFAVYDDGPSEPGLRGMRTELVPYDLLTRLTIRASPAHGAHIGFHQATPPVLQAAPEETLQMAGTPRAPRPIGQGAAGSKMTKR